MRLAFFGSGEFGLPTLQALLDNDHEVLAVVTQPDRPAGRGGKCRATPIKALALERGIPVLQPEKPNSPEFVAEFAAVAPDLAVIVAYGHLIKRALLDIPPMGFVNLHASLLPAYRGAAPVPWAILRGETVSGATVFRLDETFDTGAVLGQVSLPISPDDDSGSYLRKLAPLGASLMARSISDLVSGRAAPKAQDSTLASLAPKFKKGDGEIDWTKRWDEIECAVRAFQPWPLAFTMLPTAKGALRVNVLRLDAADSEPGDFRPGQILAADQRNGLVVMTGDRPARLALIQPEGKRPMPDKDFLRGTKISP